MRAVMEAKQRLDGYFTRNFAVISHKWGVEACSTRFKWELKLGRAHLSTGVHASTLDGGP